MTAPAYLALSAFAVLLGAGQTRPADADWEWLNKFRWQALETLMPVDQSSGVVTFCSYRDLYQDVHESYFRIDREPRGDRFRAMIVRPEGRSLQQQLLDRHLAEPGASVEDLTRRLEVTRYQLAEAQCPQVRGRMRELSKLKISVPLDAVILHPVVYRIAIDTGAGRIDARLVDERHPLVQWALGTSAALDRCIHHQR